MSIHTFRARLIDGGLLPPQTSPTEPTIAPPTARPDHPDAVKYAYAALRSECDHIAAAHTGTRNDTLNTAAYNIGQLVAGGYLSEQESLDAITAAARTAGLPETEIQRTAPRSLRDGSQHPRSVRMQPPEPVRAAYSLTHGNSEDTAAGTDTAAFDTIHRGQVRLAYRVADHYTGQLLYVAGVGWHSWNGTRWSNDDTGAATRAVLDVVRRALADAVNDPPLVADARKCETANGISGVLTIAATLDPLHAPVSLLDADPYLLNVANGTLDLRNGQLHEHTPGDKLTRLCRAAYRPDTEAPRWQAFLQRILPDSRLREFVQRLVGMALLGRVVEQILPIFTGTGANGKSVFISAISHALGDHAGTAEPDLFLNRAGAHPTGEMDLMGRRWITVSESDKDRRLAEATMKRLTGGDTIRARRMHHDFIEFTPSHTAVLVTNHLPQVSGDDQAVWRRLRVVPFDVVIPTHEQDPNLTEALQLEADGILAWAVAGYQQWQRRGLDEPPMVQAATDRYHSDSNDITRFIDERCYAAADAFTTPTEIHVAYQEWARRDGAAPQMSMRAFSQTLTTHGYAVSKSNGLRVIRGLGLLAADGSFSA